MKKSKEALEEFIRKEISKSGFPLELSTSIRLNKIGWKVYSHIFFYDEEKEHISEVDIIAEKRDKIKRNVRHVLVIECKKQESKPWVLFKQETPNVEADSLNITPNSLYPNFATQFKNHYYFKGEPCSYHFPFFTAKREKRDVISEAIDQVLSALSFRWEQEENFYESYHLNRVSIFYPIVILDGRLFSAVVQPDGTIKLSESRYLQLKVSRALREPFRMPWIDGKYRIIFIKNYLIDIVRKDYLEDFLENFL